MSTADETDEYAEELIKYVRDIMGLAPGESLVALAAAIGMIVARNDCAVEKQEGLLAIMSYIQLSFAKEEMDNDN